MSFWQVCKKVAVTFGIVLNIVVLMALLLFCVVSCSSALRPGAPRRPRTLEQAQRWAAEAHNRRYVPARPR